VTRVAFLMTHTDFSWVGGINYIRNLVRAIHLAPERRLEPVLIAPPGVPDEILRQFPDTDLIRSDEIADRRSQRVKRKLWRLATGVDRPLERVLRRHGISLVSHSWHVDRSADIASVEWIPDFQHRHLPAFFSESELSARDRAYRKTAQRCSALILSSQTAMNDLASFYPPAVAKSHVLHFCSSMGGSTAATPADELERKYAIGEPYFHLPNQFWAHKNHRVVIDALAHLRARGRRPLVLCTGHTNDSRNPGHFDELMRHAAAQGVADTFRVLGLVPFGDLHGLLQGAVAVINPSLFEGWSSTVEESKALGKAVILSDLPVHREQAPPRGAFFAADDPHALGRCMAEALDAFDPQVELAERAAAALAHEQSFREFGRAYQDIVARVISA
jgi:glycosyltransferase involved in cell wall biosynthesis